MVCLRLGMPQRGTEQLLPGSLVIQPGTLIRALLELNSLGKEFKVDRNCVCQSAIICFRGQYWGQASVSSLFARQRALARGGSCLLGGAMFGSSGTEFPCRKFPLSICKLATPNNAFYASSKCT
eukprot:6460690-Amphidinium_carterae.1